MADDPTPTPSSDPTPTPDPTPVPAPSDPAADPAPAVDPAADPASDPAPEPTALGGAGEPDPNADPAADPDAAANAVPETYELAVPEGFEKLDEEAVALATPVFKELGLNNEQANKLIPVAAQFAKRVQEGFESEMVEKYLQQRSEWGAKAKADPEIGGANWDGSVNSAGKALDLLGFPAGCELRQEFERTNLGNHPDLIRLLAKVGKAIGEGTDFPRGNAGGGKKTDAEIFYGVKS